MFGDFFQKFGLSELLQAFGQSTSVPFAGADPAGGLFPDSQAPDASLHLAGIGGAGAPASARALAAPGAAPGGGGGAASPAPTPGAPGAGSPLSPGGNSPMGGAVAGQQRQPAEMLPTDLTAPPLKPVLPGQRIGADTAVR